MIGKIKLMIMFVLVLLGSTSHILSQQTEKKEEQPEMKATVAMKS